MAPMRIGNYSYNSEPVGLGDLSGNHFTLKIRELATIEKGMDLEECVGEGIRALEERGFVNYFGLQRFGMSGALPIAPLVGLAMLRGEHVSCLVGGSEGEGGGHCPLVSLYKTVLFGLGSTHVDR